jgi:hypothetical protein
MIQVEIKGQDLTDAYHIYANIQGYVSAREQRYGWKLDFTTISDACGSIKRAYHYMNKRGEKALLKDGGLIFGTAKIELQ